MATTVLTNQSNRFASDNYLHGSVATVALDAAIGEQFTLPVGFGSLITKMVTVQIGALSGAYVAPAPPFDGLEISIISADATTRVDIVGARGFVNYSTGTARPALAVWFDLENRVLVRLGERFFVQGPIIAGAGVTGTVVFGCRGTRFQTA